MTLGEAVACVVMAFWWGFVAALWLHDPIVRRVNRMADMAMRKNREDK